MDSASRRPEESFALPKGERLLKRAEFKALSRAHQRFHTRHFTCVLRPNHKGTRRLGITVSRKIGNAVQRNRVKRLVREYFRLHKSCFPQGSDILVIAKKDASDLDFQRLAEEFAASRLFQDLRS